LKKHKIGIVGSCGIVGSAHAFAFRKLGHEVKEYDLKLPNTLLSLCDCEVIFICVPTPPKEDGSCDTSIVCDIVDKLADWEYDGVVCIKSTVTPGTTMELIEGYLQFKFEIVFSPEFLRERSAISDIIENHRLLAIGTSHAPSFELVKDCYGYLPKKVVQLRPTEAELLKYFNNVFGALRVVFANEFYDICESLDGEYYSIKEAFIALNNLPNIYFDVNPDTARSYDSICWNKDVPALVHLAKWCGLNLPILYHIEESNNRHIKTPFAGTRSHY
jgi:UDPglucose 6-dehydrogenase